MGYNEQVEARITILEARLSLTEQRMSAMERRDWSTLGAKPEKKPRRELTPEQKVEIRERLVKGQEAARARREAEAKAAKKKEKVV